MDDAYLYRTEEDASPYKFKLELAEGTFEMYGHINSYGFMDYSFFLEKRIGWRCLWWLLFRIINMAILIQITMHFVPSRVGLLSL